jgi:hypothetical protein
VEAVIHEKLETPPQILKVMGGTKSSTKISSYDELRSFLIPG